MAGCVCRQRCHLMKHVLAELDTTLGHIIEQIICFYQVESSILLQHYNICI